MSSCDHIDIKFGQGKKNVNDKKNNEYRTIVECILREHLESYYAEKSTGKKNELCEQVFQKINEKLAEEQKSSRIL
jgi:hypothetical protein